MTWFVVTLVLALILAVCGFLFGRFLSGLPIWGFLLAAAAAATAISVATDWVYADSPALGWWVATVCASVLAGVFPWLIGMGEVSRRTLVGAVALTVAVAVVGAVAFHAGSISSTVTVKTPHDRGNAAALDPADCSQASLSATRTDKPHTWAALGDSYSAGVGGELNGTAYGQDITNAFAWVGARQLFNPVSGAYFGLQLSACTGAVTRDLFHTLAQPDDQLAYEDLPDVLDDKFWWGLPDGLQTLRGAAVATLTIGGNDAGFGNIARSLGSDRGCARGKSCRLLADGGLANIAGTGRNPIPVGNWRTEWDELRARLVNAYSVSLALLPKEADLFVIKYPLAFDVPTRGCLAARAIGPRNMGLINRFTAKLGQTIDEAAEKTHKVVGRPVHVLTWGNDAWKSTRNGFGKDPAPYSGYGLCGKDPWINDFGPLGRFRAVDDSFHPSTSGVVAAACAVARAIFEQSLFVRPEGYKLAPTITCPRV